MAIQHRFQSLFLVLSIMLFLGLSTLATSHAAKLSDLIKQTPKLYLPSQVVAGQPAAFTVQGKPGRSVKLILSPMPDGAELPDGTALKVGKPIVEKSGTIPASGVLELKVDIPSDSSLLGDKQFAEALIWSDSEQSDIEIADVVEHSGLRTGNNAIPVGIASDGGTMLVVPGDPGITNLLRSVSTMNDIGNDSRKRQLIDDGNINRKRLIDQNLITTPNP